MRECGRVSLCCCPWSWGGACKRGRGGEFGWPVGRWRMSFRLYPCQYPKRKDKKEKHTSIRLRDGLVGGAGAILGLVKSPTTCPPAGPSASLLVSLLISLLVITPAPGVVGCDDAADGGAGSAGG